MVVIVINFLPDHTPLLLLPSAPLISIVDVFILTGDIDRASRPILFLRGSVSLSVCYHQGISCLKATRRSEVAWPVTKSYLRMYLELWQLGHVWVGDNPDLGEQPDRTVSLLHWEGDQLSSAFVLGHTGPDMFHFLCEGVKQIKKIKKFGINLLWNLIFQNIKALFLSIF